MTVKKEDSGRRSVQVEVEVPGTPEEVWQAIATGPGVSAWFVPTTIDGRTGGTIGLDFGGGMVATADILEWDPPRYLSAVAPPQVPGAPPFATEWYVESSTGGSCVVRVVHSLFADTDDWDDQLTGTESGWPAFFKTLRLYLTHFKGLPSAITQQMAMSARPTSEVWADLTRALGFEGAAAGDRREAPDGTPPLAGTVEASRHEGNCELLVRTDVPAPGAAHFCVVSTDAEPCPGMPPGMTFLSMRLFFYGEGAEAAMGGASDAWAQWLAGLFPPPQAPADGGHEQAGGA